MAATRSRRRDAHRLARVRALRSALETEGSDARLWPARILEGRDLLLDSTSRAEAGDLPPAGRLHQGTDLLLRALSRPGEGARPRGDGGAAFPTLERLLRLLPDAVFTLRPSGRPVLWSVGASRLTGRKRAEVQRRGVQVCFASPSDLDALLEEADRGLTAAPRELRIRHASGALLPVRAFAARLQNAPVPEGRAVARWLVLLHDLTEVHRIRQRLIETEKLSAMAKIAGSVAHEFRNPLNSLFLNTDLLEDELEGSEEVRESIAPLLAAIREEIERLNQIITHYLALSKIGGAQREELDLAAWVREFAEEHTELAQGRGVVLRTRVAQGEHRIHMDPNQLRRVLLNLVENAMDACTERSEDDRPRPVVTLAVRRVHRWVKLTVKDNGLGIPEEVLDRVFEPFFTSKEGGAGLGLYLVREIVLASAGTMSLSSQPGGGTSVSIRWPAVDLVRSQEVAS